VVGVSAAHLGPICVNGVLHAAADVGGTELRDGVGGRLVVVTGGGPIGLLVGVLAQLHGAAEVVVVDPTPERRAAALALGLLVTDVVAFDEAPSLFAALSARRRHVITAVLRVDGS
jgi:threonine dehydrogenase-like Zn-dependent dehydrogenase